MKEKLAEFLITIQGFRKFIVALLVILVSIVFRTKSLLNGVEFVDLVKAVTLGFLGTNSVEGITAVIKDHLAQRREAGNVLVPPPSAPTKSEDEEVDIVAAAGDGK